MRGLAIGRRDIFDDPPVAVFTHDTLAGLAGEPLIKALLNALNPLAIDVSEANEVSGYFTRRIVAARLFPQMNARQLEFADVIGHIRVNLTRQIDKTHPRIGIDTRCQLIQRHIQRIGQRLPAVVERHAAGFMQLFRVSPDGFYRYAHRQRAAGTIGYHAARGGDLLHAQRTHVPLTYQHVRANYL